MAQLMIVEDDEQIGQLLESGLSAEGHAVARQRTGRGALQEAGELSLDLVVLDLGLPDMDGIAVCRELRRSQPGTVIVMLTARDEEMDLVAGLESGADDYLTKPFSLVELVARTRAHLRRSTFSDDGGHRPLTVGQLTLDVPARQCSIAGIPVPLRMREYDLLLRLAVDAGAVVTRTSLMSDVWDENWWGSTKTLDVHIAALRRRLAEAAEAAGVDPPTITTFRGHGYLLEKS